MATTKVVSKLLSMCLLVSREGFAAQSAAEQTATLTAASGKPIVFVENFASLKNKRKLTERLLAGEDVSMELEFNEIILTDDEKKALSDVKPVLERLNAKTPGEYDWQIGDDEAASYLRDNGWSMRNGTPYSTPGGYEVNKTSAEKIWKIASRYWHTGEKPEKSSRIVVHYDSRTITAQKESVKIGCQTFTRKDVEACAICFGFEPVTE